MLSCSFIIQILCERLWFHSPYGQEEWSELHYRGVRYKSGKKKKKKLNLSFKHPSFASQLSRMTKTVYCESLLFQHSLIYLSLSSISICKSKSSVAPRKKEEKWKEKKWLLFQMCGRCLNARCWIPQISQHSGVFLVLVCAGCCSTSYDDLSKVSQSKFVCLLKCSLCVCVLCRIFLWSAEEVALGWQASC